MCKTYFSCREDLGADPCGMFEIILGFLGAICPADRAQAIAVAIEMGRPISSLLAMVSTKAVLTSRMSRSSGRN